MVKAVETCIGEYMRVRERERPSRVFVAVELFSMHTPKTVACYDLFIYVDEATRP